MFILNDKELVGLMNMLDTELEILDEKLYARDSYNTGRNSGTWTQAMKDVGLEPGEGIPPDSPFHDRLRHAIAELIAINRRLK